MIVGGGPAAALVADTIRRHPWTGVELVGVLGDAGGAHGLPVLGSEEQLIEVALARGIDEVILMPEAPSWRDRLPEKIPEGFEADLLVWPSPFETMIGRLRFRIVGDLPLLEARVRPLDGAAAFAKRAFDFVAAAAALLLLAPGLALAAVLVGRDDSRGASSSARPGSDATESRSHCGSSARCAKARSSRPARCSRFRMIRG